MNTAKLLYLLLSNLFMQIRPYQTSMIKLFTKMQLNIVAKELHDAEANVHRCSSK